MEERRQRTEPGKEWVKGSLGLDRKLWGGERPPPETLTVHPSICVLDATPKCNSYFLDQAGYFVSILINTFSVTFCFVRCCTLSSWNCAKYTPWLMTCNHSWSLLSPSYLRYLVTLHNKHCQANLTQVFKMKKKKNVPAIHTYLCAYLLSSHFPACLLQAVNTLNLYLSFLPFILLFCFILCMYIYNYIINMFFNFPGYLTSHS